MFMAGSTFAADSMKDRVDSWTQRPVEGPALRGNAIDGEDVVADPQVGGPISDGLYVLMALTGAYMLIRKRKKLQNQISE